MAKIVYQVTQDHAEIFYLLFIMPNINPISESYGLFTTYLFMDQWSACMDKWSAYTQLNSQTYNLY